MLAGCPAGGAWHAQRSHAPLLLNLQAAQQPPIVFHALPRSERDRLYERAERVGALLSHLGEQLKEAIADVNDSTGGRLRQCGSAHGGVD